MQSARFAVTVILISTEEELVHVKGRLLFSFKIVAQDITTKACWWLIAKPSAVFRWSNLSERRIFGPVQEVQPEGTGWEEMVQLQGCSCPTHSQQQWQCIQSARRSPWTSSSLTLCRPKKQKQYINKSLSKSVASNVCKRLITN